MLSIVDFPQAYTKVHLPSKVALVVSRKPDHNYNMITVEWFMRTSIQPPQFAISIGHSRYSYDCLSDFGYFNLVLPSPELKPVLSLADQIPDAIWTSCSFRSRFQAGKFQRSPYLQKQSPILSVRS
jgi:flavin reductase (DIM6/NTAB) family NADH-FMN oxidoreductase RutF